MPLSSEEIDRLASAVDEAASTATAIAQLSEATPFDVADAYRIQAASIDRRLARGERRIGLKMGFTSRAKMAQMGVDDLICGRLTDAMRLEEGGALELARFVHPRIEPEVCFLLSRTLDGPVSAGEAMTAVEAVAPAMEVIDSRYKDFKFSLADVVADNASSSGVVIGPWTRAPVALDALGIVFEVDGRPAATGSTAGILGHPGRALAAAARMASEAGEPLPAGSVVMAGAATAAVAIEAGRHYRVTVQDLGRAGIAA